MHTRHEKNWLKLSFFWRAWQVISTSGDTHLGGEDFDHRVMDYFIKLIKKKYKVDISKDNRALQKLRREAERAKRALSSQHQVRLHSHANLHLPMRLDMSYQLSGEACLDTQFLAFAGQATVLQCQESAHAHTHANCGGVSPVLVFAGKQAIST